MIIYAFILLFSLISSVRGSIYVQAPNHVPKSYLETLIRKFAKPLKDIQELTGEGVQLEFSIRSPDEVRIDVDQNSEKTSAIRRSLRGKMLKKRGPSRIRSIPRLSPARIRSQQTSHLQTIKPRGRAPIRQPNKPLKRPPLGINKLPNRPSSFTKAVNVLKSWQHLISQSQPSQNLAQTQTPQQRSHQERITTHNQPPLPPLHNLPASSASHPAMPPGLSHTTIMTYNYHPQHILSKGRSDTLFRAANSTARRRAKILKTSVTNKKAIDLEDINKAFIDMEKRLSSGIANESKTDSKNVLNGEVLNKTLQMFEKRILNSIGDSRQRELNAPLSKEKQRAKLLCDDAKMLQEAFKPVLFEDLWKYLGKHKCEEEYSPSAPLPEISKQPRKSMQLEDILNDNDREDDTNDNIFIHTGDHLPPIKIPLANVYSRLIY